MNKKGFTISNTKKDDRSRLLIHNAKCIIYRDVALLRLFVFIIFVKEKRQCV